MLPPCVKKNWFASVTSDRLLSHILSATSFSATKQNLCCVIEPAKCAFLKTNSNRNFHAFDSKSDFNISWRRHHPNLLANTITIALYNIRANSTKAKYFVNVSIDFFSSWAGRTCLRSNPPWFQVANQEWAVLNSLLIH